MLPRRVDRRNEFPERSSSSKSGAGVSSRMRGLMGSLSLPWNGGGHCFWQFEFIHETVDGLKQSPRAFLLRDVAALGKDDETGVFPSAGKLDGLFGWYHSVVISSDDQDRHRQFAESPGDVERLTGEQKLPESAVPVLGLERQSVA